MDSYFEQFESDVMRRIIAENADISDVLTKQYQSAKVIGRDFTGVGFFTDFEIPDADLRLTSHSNLELGAVQVKLESLKFGAGFVLFIRDGLIQSLECYTYGEPWPENVNGYMLE